MTTKKQKTSQKRPLSGKKGVIKVPGCIIIPGDPTIDISQFAGMWADRDDITAESLRRKAWGYGDR